MSADAVAAVAMPAGCLHLRVPWLCGAVLFLEGYDIASVGYAVPSLVDVWKVHPQAFTPVLTAGNVGLLLGSLFAGLLGDRLGRKPVLIACAVVFGFFSLLSAFMSPASHLKRTYGLTQNEYDAQLSYQVGAVPRAVESPSLTKRISR